MFRYMVVWCLGLFTKDYTKRVDDDPQSVVCESRVVYDGSKA